MNNFGRFDDPLKFLGGYYKLDKHKLKIRKNAKAILSSTYCYLDFLQTRQDKYFYSIRLTNITN
jgi:hypothetical protein